MRKKIINNKSEEIFKGYLKDNKLKYRRHYMVNKNSKNVDFYIKFPRKGVFCDVKEVRISKKGEIIAYKALKKHISKLREKFRGRTIIRNPILLITFNFSDNFFTGETVVHAMLGDLHMVQNITKDKKSSKKFFHKGNEVLTKNQKTAISGVFIYRTMNPHILLKNPFAKNPINNISFPNTKIISITKNYTFSRLKNLTNVMIRSHKTNAE